ncbi:MAG: TetR/AcrR family transcriptional regulator [Conexibacter sp.]|nr:TetR/AcrR family transcriptional regulator [Conexibacter sp.]
MSTAASGKSKRNSYEDLVDVATTLFSERGYAGTTVRMIADALGVQSGSLYSHISSKEEVLKRIVLSVAQEFLDGARAATEGEGSPEERLRALCRNHLSVVDRRQAAVTVYYDEWRKLDEVAVAEITAQRREYEQHFVGVVEEGVASGAFVKGADVRMAVLLVLSACNWTYQWYTRRGPMTPEEISDSFVEITLKGLLRR